MKGVILAQDGHIRVALKNHTKKREEEKNIL